MKVRKKMLEMIKPVYSQSESRKAVYFGDSLIMHQNCQLQYNLYIFEMSGYFSK